MDRIGDRIANDTDGQKQDHIQKHTALADRLSGYAVIEIKLSLEMTSPVLVPLVGKDIFTLIVLEQIIFVQIFLLAANAVATGIVQLVVFINR